MYNANKTKTKLKTKKNKCNKFRKKQHSPQGLNRQWLTVQMQSCVFNVFQFFQKHTTVYGTTVYHVQIRVHKPKCTSNWISHIRSPAVARIEDRTCCQWPSKSSKVDDFHFIWKGVCHFLLVIISNLDHISHRFRDNYGQFSVEKRTFFSTPTQSIQPWIWKRSLCTRSLKFCMPRFMTQG